MNWVLARSKNSRSLRNLFGQLLYKKEGWKSTVFEARPLALNEKDWKELEIGKKERLLFIAYLFAPNRTPYNKINEHNRRKNVDK